MNSLSCDIHILKISKLLVESLKNYSYFDVTLTTNHKVYNREEGDACSQF
jgi:hypothetical protein